LGAYGQVACRTKIYAVMLAMHALEVLLRSPQAVLRKIDAVLSWTRTISALVRYMVL
jgi:hypothetical protein